MITTRTPFRISFCGGGSDLPSYYKKHGGCVVSTSIDKYMYITMMRAFDSNRLLVKYSEVENTNRPECIRHPIFRDVFTKYHINGVDINSMSDIPAGTGLGSSSSFTVGLTNAVRSYCGLKVSKRILAEEACDIEINDLHEPVGKQDQYAAAYGGLNYIRFNKDDTVDVEPILMSDEDKKELSDHLIMFYLGKTRSASKVLQHYFTGSLSSEDKTRKMCQLAEKLKDDFEKGNIESLGRILDEGWKIKRTLTDGISNEQIDDVYDLAINNGAVGGKLLGAGGNGFMLFYVEKEDKLNLKTSLSDYREMPFEFDHEGSVVVYRDDLKYNNG